ncbi:MAG: hypothetical protein J6Q83_06470 [Clostridia bacterium]|nr:hypothetical protein [Clostridia bacterium]
MAYRGSEAYDFSLFEPQVIEQPARVSKSAKNTGKGAQVKRASANAAPQRKPAPQRKAAPQRKPVQRKSNVAQFVDNYQQTVDRKASSAVIPAPIKKAMMFACFCFAMLTVLLVMQTRCDTLMSEIAGVQREIEIAEGENVRLNAELSSMISSDKIENYAENVLGMVKAESYQISYIDLSEGDEIVVSGDKTTEQTTDIATKLKALFAYID